MQPDMFVDKSDKAESKKKVWLDCDPGLDDALAIILAGGHEEIQLVGVSTSAGNTSLENTTRNALDILYNIGRSDVVVVSGSKVLANEGEMILAQFIHGANGLGGVKIPTSDKDPVTENNFQFIRDKFMASSEKIYWANTGSLTNLCWLFRKYPEVKTKIQKIVIMGGAIGKGNITPAAEFNLYFDPFAAKEVLQNKGEIPLVMIPLQLTHKVQVRQPFFQFLKQNSANPLALALYEMIAFYQKLNKQVNDLDYPPVHDPCVINYILDIKPFILKKAEIIVDTGKVSHGRTNCYFKKRQGLKGEIESIDEVGLEMKNKSEFWGKIQKILENVFLKKA